MNTKLVRLSALVLAFSISLALTGALLAKEKEKEDEESSEEEVTIEKTVLAREVEDKYEPVKSFKPDDNFAVLVFLNEPKAGTKVKAVWTVVDAGEMKDKKLLEKKVELTEENTKDVKEANRINFALTHTTPYPPGDYKTEIYLNGELAKTIEWKVKE